MVKSDMASGRGVQEMIGLISGDLATQRTLYVCVCVRVFELVGVKEREREID